MTITLALLILIVILAHFIETVTGFGATVIALALGVHLVGLNDLMVVLVLLGLSQSAYLVLRGYRHLALGLLFKKIVPLCGLGLAVGMYAGSELEAPHLQTILGAFLVFVALWELRRLLGSQKGRQSPNPIASRALLLVAGFFHGILASGGPLVVYYASRTIHDKRVFRATLSLLWLILNGILLFTFVSTGRVNSSQFLLAGQLLVGLLAGIALGELSHRRINERTFRLAVQGVLVVTGLLLLRC
jgi:uncharacterized membrane protein YfcA